MDSAMELMELTMIETMEAELEVGRKGGGRRRLCVWGCVLKYSVVVHGAAANSVQRAPASRGFRALFVYRASSRDTRCDSPAASHAQCSAALHGAGSR
jgi:hypothetical protein